MLLDILDEDFLAGGTSNSSNFIMLLSALQKSRPVLSRRDRNTLSCMIKKPDVNILDGDYNFDFLSYSYHLGSSV